MAAGIAVQAVPRTGPHLIQLRRYLVPEMMSQSRIRAWAVKSVASAVGRLRLESRDRASIAYPPRDTDFPNFLALDRGGVHWAIEGKNDGGAQDETDQLKRSAAEKHVVDLLGAPGFDHQSWGYRIACQSEVDRAGSWKDLVSSSGPVVTP